ncbi:hypothetical protein BIV25_13200 [Streptomyces sp. MUSC 14]|uniref:hypothetical protein n=1 Tax=Streptomyces sp. MUSC 14 TaxID=1354889 RepID=UPI00091DDB02|nr:hypothetical protein [Streptomyces sp. MUSC 14]OIJ97759.1 hypothetical protein BIV25_13200 [Streptomyces sp. MUSC 14]
MAVRRVVAAVYVKDPATHEDLILLPGECPAPEIAALVTNPEAWDTPLVGGPGPEPIAVGEPDPTAGGAEPNPGEDEAGGGGAKKSVSRRTRTSTA